MLSINKGLDPLLKRPISIHRSIGNNFQLLYRAVGKGTDILSTKKEGDVIEILGPLGNGFPAIKKNNKIILIAGGLGIAPIFALTESILKKRINTETVLFYGARTKKEIIRTDELKSLGIDPVISTDDGTLGKKGNTVAALKRYLKQQNSKGNNHVIYACGPKPMLKALSIFAIKNNIEGHIALEQNMACGLGTCLGCVVNTVKGYKRVCKEGPVFPIKEIIWDNNE